MNPKVSKRGVWAISCGDDQGIGMSISTLALSVEPFTPVVEVFNTPRQNHLTQIICKGHRSSKTL